MSPPAFRLAFAQGLDALTFLAFYLFIGAGTYQEQNPIVLGIMAIGGIWLVAAVKAGIATTVALGYDRGRRLPVTTVFMSIAAASGIAGAGFNLASILRSIGV